MKKIIRIENVTQPTLPFNHVVQAGGLLFLTSQISVDLETNVILKGGIRKQTTRAMENIKLLLEASGSSMDQILRVRIYLRKVMDFDVVNEVYREYFEPGREPARVVVQAQSPIDGVDIEIEATAVAP